MSFANTSEMANEVRSKLLGGLSAQMEATLKSCDADAVHDLRVAVRRSSQALKSFDFYFDSGAVKKIRKRLKKTMRLAGCLRNIDVSMQFVNKWKIPNQDHLSKQREDAAQELIHYMERWIERGWIADLTDQMKTQPPNPALESVQDHARRLLSSMAAEFFKRGNGAADPDATPTQLHGFRIASKKFRYTMELFSKSYGSALNARIKRVKQLQTILGDVNDCVTMKDILSGDVAGKRLDKRQRRKTAQFRKLWESGFVEPSIATKWVADLSLLGPRKAPQSQRERPGVEAGVRAFGQGRRRR